MHPEEVEEVLAKCSTSIKSHIQVFHPDRFFRDFSPYHEKLFEVLDDPTQRRVAVIAHRSFGKTSIFNFGIPSQAIMFRKSNFLVPISATADHAVMQSENLKRDLRTNPAIKALLGDIKSELFSKEIWIARHPEAEDEGIMVLPRGCEQQIRGIIHGHHRPNFLIVDDLEKSEAVKNEEQRKKVKEWIISDLLGCLDHSDSAGKTQAEGRVLAIGTILHEDSWLQNLRGSKKWTVLEFPLCDPEYKSYWPAYMSDAGIQALREEYEEQNELHIFYREYMNDPFHQAVAAFKREYFLYYEEGDEDLNNHPDVENIVIVDPTRSGGETASFSAIVGLGLNLRTNRVYVRDVVNERLTNDALYEAIDSMAIRINAQVIGVEVTGLKEFITKPLLDFFNTRGRIYEVIELNPRRAPGQSSGGRDKEGRIRQLAAYYRLGFIFHNRTACEELENQLLLFPNSKYLDIPDALAYFIQMTEKGDRYFAMRIDGAGGEEEALAQLIAANDDLDEEADLLMDESYEEELYATFDY